GAIGKKKGAAVKGSSDANGSGDGKATSGEKAAQGATGAKSTQSTTTGWERGCRRTYVFIHCQWKCSWSIPSGEATTISWSATRSSSSIRVRTRSLPSSKRNFSISTIAGGRGASPGRYSLYVGL